MIQPPLYFNQSDATIRRSETHEVVAWLKVEDRDLGHQLAAGPYLIEELLRVWGMAREGEDVTEAQAKNLLAMITRVSRRAFAKVMRLEDGPDEPLLPG